MPGVHLIFFGGGHTKAENWTFEHAANNVKGSYPASDTILVSAITTAAEVCRKITAQRAGAIKSLDILCHGGGVAMHFYKSDAHAGFFLDKAKQKIYADPHPNGLGKKFTNGWEVVDRIEFNKFANDARIELHMCNGADLGPDENIVAKLSRLLYNAGAKRAVAIGHFNQAHPMILGKMATKDKQQDYRHGKRVVYHKGKQLFPTEAKGHISDATIASYLPKK